MRLIFFSSETIFQKKKRPHMPTSLRDAVIVSACRTPIGKIRGALSSFRPDDLLALALREAAKRVDLPDNQFDEVYAGCANQSGEDNRNVARMSTLIAGFLDELPGVTVNRLCASGLEAVIQGARSISVGDNELILAGGVESMSRAPWVLAKPSTGFAPEAPAIYDTSLGWRFPNPILGERIILESMGETAENVAELYSVSREDQDLFAFNSHTKALNAQKAGLFKDEIFGIVRKDKSGETRLIETDEGPRVDTSIEKLAKLAPVFRKNGSVTAGNSSGLNDGAAALAICSREFAIAHQLKPLAVIRGSASVGVPPQFMGIGPVSATQKVLKKLGMTVGDIDVVELNEAFAAQALAVIRELHMNEDRVNVFGGAIALGHPLGCSGARILTTLLSALAHRKGTLGLATMCVGVGQGVSLVVERI
jgi:3-oxoadipyl-CoA thiolase